MVTAALSSRGLYTPEDQKNPTKLLALNPIKLKIIGNKHTHIRILTHARTFMNITLMQQVGPFQDHADLYYFNYIALLLPL